MSNASAEPPLRLRAPAQFYAPLGVALTFAIALALAALASAGPSPFYLDAAMALAAPALIGALLFGLSMHKTLQTRAIQKRTTIAARGAVAFAVAGLVWPLSFVLAILANGDPHGAWGRTPGALLEAAICALVGGVSGALGAWAAAWACLARR